MQPAGQQLKVYKGIALILGLEKPGPECGPYPPRQPDM